MVHAAEWCQHFTAVIEHGADYWPRIGRVPVGGTAALAASKKDGWLTGEVVRGASSMGGLATVLAGIDRETSLPGGREEDLFYGRGILHLAPETLLLGMSAMVFSPYVTNTDKFDAAAEFRERTGHVPIVVVPRREVTAIELERVKVMGLHTQDIVHLRGRHPTTGRVGELRLQISWRRPAGAEAEDVATKDQSPAVHMLEAWAAGA